MDQLFLEHKEIWDGKIIIKTVDSNQILKTVN